MPSALISASLLEDELDGLRREACGRLVEQQQPRRGDERAGEREQLALTAGERPGALPRPLAQEREEVVDPFDRRAALALAARRARRP